MSPVTHHRELVVWQRAMQLLAEAYAIARQLPRAEAFGMTNQLRRAAVSIPANVAEGHGRLHRGDFVRHLSIAQGSLAELETLLDATELLGYMGKPELATARTYSDEVRRMLRSMILRLREKPAR